VSVSFEGGTRPEYVVHGLIFSTFTLAGGGGDYFSGPVPPIGGPEGCLKFRVLLSSLSRETVVSIRSVLEAFIRVRGNTKQKFFRNLTYLLT
jgi:hypothetical protein